MTILISLITVALVVMTVVYVQFTPTTDPNATVNFVERAFKDNTLNAFMDLYQKGFKDNAQCEKFTK
jgi:hypothetical protein